MRSCNSCWLHVSVFDQAWDKDGWTLIALLFCAFICLGQLKRKKERGQYSVILTEQTWSIKDLLYGQKRTFTGETNAGNPVRTRRARAANQNAGFASSRGFSHIIKRCAQSTYLGSLNTFCIKVTNSSDDIDHTFTTSATPDCFIVLAL